MGVIFTVTLVLLARLLVVGFLPVPENPKPRFDEPELLLPQLWLPLLLLPKLAMPLFPTPKLRWPTLLRPMLPFLSGVHLVAPLGRHSTAISQEQDGHQHAAPEDRSVAEATFARASRVATL